MFRHFRTITMGRCTRDLLYSETQQEAKASSDSCPDPCEASPFAATLSPPPRVWCHSELVENWWKQRDPPLVQSRVGRTLGARPEQTTVACQPH